MTTAAKCDNRLARETSPYLLQHAGDPVAWQPWDEAALAAASEQDKPILLSIGYSACHWCHVMAHESFQDEETAALMNELFVNIKVDREERPDLDKIYQVSQMLVSRRPGGWPLTVFLLPQDQTPFFGGTYFPKEQRHGLPPFKEVLRRVHDYYRSEKGDLHRHSRAVHEALERIFAAGAAGEIAAAALAEQAVESLAGLFDPQYGGFGNEPKFPNCHYIDFLFKHAARNCDGRDGRDGRRALHMALFTLERICRGGICDQIGGGFYRYSVDERWAVPHFEKMLYDNAGLLGLLAQAWRISGNELYLQSATAAADWAVREMQSADGGYYAALDADSEGREGKYYVWSAAQAQEVLGEDYAVCAAYFGLDEAPNFEGAWHLHQKRTVAEVAAMFALGKDAVRQALARGRRRMLECRERRVRPLRDEKVLCSWNALLIKNMARMARLTGAVEYGDSAVRALEFVRRTLWRDGRLLATCKDGRAKLNAYLDDYAFLADAVLELCQMEWRTERFAFACEIADTMIEQFEDAENGGFFFTSHGHERLLQRPRVLADEATPSGYGAAVHVLVVLGCILGRERYLQVAERAIAQAAQAVAQSPENHTSLLHAALEHGDLPEVLIIRAGASGCTEWLAEAARHYDPLRICLAIPAAETVTVEGLADKTVRGEACAYSCRGAVCLAPIEDFEEFKRHLRASALKAGGVAAA